MRPILITGDSHTAPLFRGLHDELGLVLDKDVVFWALGRGGNFTSQFYSLDPEQQVVQTHIVDAPAKNPAIAPWANRTYSVRDVQIDGRDPVVVVSMPMNTNRIVRNIGLGGHMPWRMVRNAKETPVSDQAMKAVIEDDVIHILGFVRALKQIGLDVVVVDSPRSFRDAPLLQKMRVDVALEIAAQFRNHVLAELKDAGVPLIEQPAVVIAADGLMNNDYAHESPLDQYHGGKAYGRVMMTQIRDYVAKHYPEI